MITLQQFQSGVGVFAVIVEEIAGFLAILAALVSLPYVWHKALVWRIVYAATAVTIVIALAAIAYTGGWTMLRYALFGPAADDHHGGNIEHLNVMAFWLVLFFFSIPFWRDRVMADVGFRPRHNRSSSS